MTNEVWFDETDASLDDAAARYLRERYRFEVRYKLPAAERRFSRTVWNDVAEMGWLAVTTPEEDEGLGVRMTSVCLLGKAAGRGLLNEPLTSGLVAAWAIASSANVDQRETLLPRLHAGHLRVACVFAEGDEVRVEGGALHGRKTVVIDADIADHLLVLVQAAGQAPTLHLVEAGAPGVRREVYPLLDGRGAATVTFDGCRATLLGEGNAVSASAVHRAMLLGALATAADSYGAMSATFDLTLEYLKTRRQFSKPIGTHQVLQHRAVDMHIRVGESKAVLDKAAVSLQAGTDSAARDVHAAKAFVCDEARKLAHDAVQMHGGIGITDEYAVSHYLRRIRVNEQLYGSTEQHFQWFAAASAASDTHATNP
jgi:alkylation response protein AidB-like acyl-CoA dehydrogenase